MTSLQKISLSLLFAILSLALLIFWSFSGLFDVLETNFLRTKTLQEYTEKAQSSAQDIDSYFKKAQSLIAKTVSTSSFIRVYLSNQSQDDILERTALFREMQLDIGLDRLRIYDLQNNLQYSSDPQDYKQLGGTRLELKTRDLLSDTFELDSSFSNARDFSLPYLDPKADAIYLFSSMEDEYGVQRGFASAKIPSLALEQNLQRYKLNWPLAHIAILGSGSFALNLPRTYWEDLKINLASGLSNFEENNNWLETKNGDHRWFVQNLDANNIKYFYLIDSGEITLSELMKVLLLTLGALTGFLLVFLVLNIKQDDYVVVNKRLKQLQITLLKEYVENNVDKSPARLKADLLSGKSQMFTLLKQGLSAKTQKAPWVDELIETSWERIVALLGAQNSSATLNGPSLDMTRMEELLQKVLSSGIVNISASNAGLAKASKELSKPAKPKAKEPLNEPDEVDELEEIEEAEALEALEEEGAVEELDEADELEEIEEAEALEALEEEGAVEEPDEVDELEEIEEVEALEALEEEGAVEEPDEADELEEIEEAEALETLEEEAGTLENLEALGELEAAETADVEEIIEDLEVLEELEPEELEAYEEVDAPNIISFPVFDELIPEVQIVDLEGEKTVLEATNNVLDAEPINIRSSMIFSPFIKESSGFAGTFNFSPNISYLQKPELFEELIQFSKGQAQVQLLSTLFGKVKKADWKFETDPEGVYRIPDSVYKDLAYSKADTLGEMVKKISRVAEAGPMLQSIDGLFTEDFDLSDILQAQNDAHEEKTEDRTFYFRPNDQAHHEVQFDENGLDYSSYLENFSDTEAGQIRALYLLSKKFNAEMSLVFSLDEAGFHIKRSIGFNQHILPNYALSEEGKALLEMKQEAAIAVFTSNEVFKQLCPGLFAELQGASSLALIPMNADKEQLFLLNTYSWHLDLKSFLDSYILNLHIR